MTNKEKYAEQILDIACSGGKLAVTLDNNIVRCNSIICRDCRFSGYNNNSRDCEDVIKEWSEQEYVEPPVDWSKVAVDAMVLARDYEDEEWIPAHFAIYKGQEVYVWSNGRTSWTCEGVSDFCHWNYTKLAEVV